MPKYYEGHTQNPIIFNLLRRGLQKSDLCKAVGVTEHTLNNYIQKPHTMRLEQILILAGLFGMPVEELVYILIRNKPQLNEAGKWYLEEIKERNK